MIVDTDDLVGIKDIADMVGVGSACVVNWKKRHMDFPKPIVTVSHGTPIYLRQDIKQWLVNHGKVTL